MDKGAGWSFVSFKVRVGPWEWMVGAEMNPRYWWVGYTAWRACRSTTGMAWCGPLVCGVRWYGREEAA